MVSAPLVSRRRDVDSKARLRLWVRLLRATRLVESETRERFKTQFDMTLPRFDVMAITWSWSRGARSSSGRCSPPI